MGLCSMPFKLLVLSFKASQLPAPLNSPPACPLLLPVPTSSLHHRPLAPFMLFLPLAPWHFLVRKGDSKPAGLACFVQCLASSRSCTSPRKQQPGVSLGHTHPCPGLPHLASGVQQLRRPLLLQLPFLGQDSESVSAGVNCKELLCPHYLVLIGD